MTQQLRAIEVMVSSKVEAPIATGEKLTEVRRRIAQELTSTPSTQSPLFKVWLSEDEGAGGQDETSWSACMAEAARCQILLVLYNGQAGWLRGRIGICHAEYLEGVRANPAKVRVVRVECDQLDGTKKAAESSSTTPDVRFYDDLGSVNAFRSSGRTLDEVVNASTFTVWTAVADLVRSGNRAGGRGTYYSPQGITWSSKDYASRAASMRKALLEALTNDGPEAALTPPGLHLVTRQLAGTSVAFRVGAVPGSLAEPEAKAFLEQPFRQEIPLVREIKRAGAVGPIEVVAVHQNATETQIRRLIGRPDTFVARQWWGILASDETTCTQILVLTGARDAVTIANRLGGALEWVRQQGLEEMLVNRARGRTTILDVLAGIADK
jgi:hypothetical protein